MYELSSNIDAFLAETNKEIKKLQEKQVSEAKKIVLGAYSSVVELSPVKDGLFRNNNFIEVNTKNNPTTETEDKDSSSVISKAMPQISKMKFKNNDVITISNSLDYADRLESGWSSQRPDNPAIYGVTERKVKRELAKRIKI